MPFLCVFIFYSQIIYRFLIDNHGKESIISYERSKKVKFFEVTNMSGMSDKIQAFIIELLKNEAPDEWLELGRNELASVFGCVPSQINYVISTRFSAEQGYMVESRRGGGGYIRIRRIDNGGENPVYTVIKSVGGSLDYTLAKQHIIMLRECGAISEQAADIILAAVSDTAINTSQPSKDRLRANIFKNTLAVLI